MKHIFDICVHKVFQTQFFNLVISVFDSAVESLNFSLGRYNRVLKDFSNLIYNFRLELVGRITEHGDEISGILSNT